ncbi:MAG: Gfo/Idh/MocA family protein [Candidatus Heimdallarchaeaceae archaeon]
MVKVGLIGIGYWGKNHLRVLRQLRDEGLIDQIVCCDTNEVALKRAKKHDNIEVEKNWKKLLEDESLDMVTIAAPTPLHYSMSKLFLEAQKDVLVEKPMAMTVEECEDLIQISKERNAGLMVGHIFRFHPAILELKKRVDYGEFGDILYIIIKRQTLTTPRKDMGVMLALGIHEVDLTCFILGDQEPDSIFADLNKYFTNREEMALIIQKFGNTTAYSFESWVDPSKGKLRELHLIGSLGGASLNFSVPNKLVLHHSYLTQTDTKNNKKLEVVNGGDFEILLEPKEPLYEEIKHFVLESQKNKNYKANGIIGMRAVKMISKALESNEKKRFMQL